MGADGGTFAQRSEMVRTKNDGGASLVDPMQVARLLWTLCRLSREALSAPVVADELGRLYNKEAVLLHLATRAKDNRETAHLRRIADVTTLTLAKNPNYTPGAAETLSSASATSGYQVPFVCPLSQRPMNGKTRFVFLRSCGCAMAEVALKAVVGSNAAAGENVVAGAKRKLSPTGEAEAEGSASPSAPSAAAESQLPCPVCSVPFSSSTLTRSGIEAGGDILLLNPSEAEEAPMRAAMEARHASQAKEAKEKKARKKAAAAAAEGDVVDLPAEEAERRTAKEARKAEKARLKAEALEPHAKRARIDSADKVQPTVSIAGSAAAQLAAQAKAAASKELSPAMRSLYGLDRPASDGRDTWMTRGTFNRFA